MVVSEQELMEKSGVEGYYILSSKQITSKYYNLKDLYCKEHNLVLDYFVEQIANDFDTVVSIELGGALIAAGLSERLNKALAIYRKERPNIGRPFGKCVIVEDVSTTGNSINILKKWIEDISDASVKQIIIGINRQKPLRNKK